MTPSIMHDLVLGPLFSVLPDKMCSTEAKAMMLAIGMQESRFKHRRQIGGPAIGFWQFEAAGIQGVLTHHASQEYADSLLALLNITNHEPIVYRAIQYNDLLAAGFARLLLWTLPSALSKRDEPQKGWQQYLQAWRPGKPHEETWAMCWDEAWGAIDRAVD